MISEGQRNDINYAIPVLEHIKDIRGSQILADRGYDSQKLIDYIFATRYNKLACSYLGFICIVSILIWLK